MIIQTKGFFYQPSSSTDSRRGQGESDPKPSRLAGTVAAARTKTHAYQLEFAIKIAFFLPSAVSRPQTAPYEDPRSRTNEFEAVMIEKIHHDACRRGQLDLALR